MNIFARLLVALPLMVWACTAASATPGASLDGRAFLSTAVTDGDQPHALVAGTRIRLAFADGRISLSAGCNTMGAAYQVIDGVLFVADLSTTEMACDPDRMAQDTWLAAFIGAQPAIELDGNDLVLRTAGTTMTLLDREVAEPDLPLVGPTWTVVSIISGDAVSSVPGDVIATLRFAADGHVAVDTGCNTGGGGYAVRGLVIRFEEIATTLIGCDGPRAQVEAAMMALLNGSRDVNFHVDASTLELTADGSGLQLQGS